MECPICMELLAHPREFPCKHIMCETCVNATMKKEGATCAKCHQVFPARSAEDFPIPYGVKDIIDGWIMSDLSRQLECIDCKENITLSDFVLCNGCYYKNIRTAMETTLDKATKITCCSMCERKPGANATTLCFQCQQKTMRKHHDSSVANALTCHTCSCTISPQKPMFCADCEPSEQPKLSFCRTCKQSVSDKCVTCDKCVKRVCDETAKVSKLSAKSRTTTSRSARTEPSILRSMGLGENIAPRRLERSGTCGNGNTRDIYFYPPGNVRLKLCSANSLLHGQWVDDAAMQFSLSHYIANIKDPYIIDKIHLVIPNHLQFLTHGQLEVLAPVAEQQQWARRELFLFALNHNQEPEQAGGAHWSLLVYVRNRDRFYYIDSLHRAHEQLARLAAGNFLSLMGRPDRPDITVVIEDRMQINGYDCGAYTLCFAKQVLYGYNPDEPFRIALSDVTPTTVFNERQYLYNTLQKYKI